MFVRMFAKLWRLLISPGLMAVVTIAGFAFGIYGTIFYEKRPGAEISVESDSPVFDVHTNVSKLSIAYAGNDLRKSNQTLRLLRIRFVNSGKTDILKQDYDENDPVGLEVRNGTIVEVPGVTASNDYLRRNMRVVTEAGKVKFSPVILESGEFLEAQLLVLTAPAAEVSISAFGKLAGIRDIKIVRADRNDEKPSPFSRAVEVDGWDAQLLRGPIYFLWFLVELMAISVVIMLLVIPIANIRDYGIKRARRNKMASYISGRVLSPCEKAVTQSYYESGADGLGGIFRLLEQVEKRNDLVNRLRPILDDTEIHKATRELYPVSAYNFHHLESSGIAKKEGPVFVVDPALPQVLRDICEVLDISEDDLKQTDAERAPSSPEIEVAVGQG